MQTTLDVDGANCPFCFNETLDQLALIPGVSKVHGSIGGSCIMIDHDDDVSLETIFDSVRSHLHGTKMYSNEMKMASIEPVDLSRSCAHHVHGTSAIGSGGVFLIEPSMTLGNIVTLKPSLAAELQRRGFDFCCHGNRTLADASLELHLDAQTVAAELSAVRRDEPPADWAFLRPDELIDHIVSVHHRYLWDELPRLGELIDRIVGVHGDRHPELIDVQDLFGDLRADFEPHLTTEEQVAFPAMRELLTSSHASDPGIDDLHSSVRSLMDEHEVVGELLEKLRVVTNDYTVPADGCASYEETYRALGALEADTHLHVHKENNVLFPAVDDATSTHLGR